MPPPRRRPTSCRPAMRRRGQRSATASGSTGVPTRHLLVRAAGSSPATARGRARSSATSRVQSRGQPERRTSERPRVQFGCGRGPSLRDGRARPWRGRRRCRAAASCWASNGIEQRPRVDAARRRAIARRARPRASTRGHRSRREVVAPRCCSMRRPAWIRVVRGQLVGGQTGLQSRLAQRRSDRALDRDRPPGCGRLTEHHDALLDHGVRRRRRRHLARDVIHRAGPASTSSHLVRRDQHVAGLRPLARPDDAAALHQVHQPAGLGEADAQLALQHRGGSELRGDDQLGGLAQQVEVVADVAVDLLGSARPRR